MLNNIIAEYLRKKETRIPLVKNSLLLFGYYYFPHYFKYSTAEFHKEMCREIQNLGKVDDNGEMKRFLTLCMFRGSAKTSFVKIDTIRQIVFGMRKMIMYGSFDKKIAENSLLDVSLELQTNQRLIDDFGQLFYDNNQDKKSKKQGVADFLTSNGVRVQAITTQKPIRGQVFKAQRPDYLVYDDFENYITKKSSAKTKTVIEHFREMESGMAGHGVAIFCCNKISDTGSVAWLYDKFENSDEGKVLEKAIIEDGKSTWESMYVLTDKEAFDKNKDISDPTKRVISLERKKRTMNKDGKPVFEQEMLNQPLVEGERFFDAAFIDEVMARVKSLEYEKDGNWKVWNHYEAGHEYRIGVDVSEGYGQDSSVIQVIDITDNKQVAELESSEMDQATLAQEIIDASNNYNKCLIAPERNSIGVGVIEILKERGYQDRIVVQKIKDNRKDTTSNRLGWHTSSSSKHKMLFDFRTDFMNGDIIINSIPLLREMRAFSNGDLRIATFDEDVSNHFDRIMAIAIANQMKYYDAGKAEIIRSKPKIETAPAYYGVIKG